MHNPEIDTHLVRCKISRAQKFWEDVAVEVRNQCLGHLNQVAFLVQCGRMAFKLTVYQVIPSRAYVASIKVRDKAPKWPAHTAI